MGRPRVLDYELIRKLYSEDRTLSEIAVMVGAADHKSVGDAIKRMGLPVRHGYLRNKFDHEQIIQLYNSGMSAMAVAVEVGCSKAEIWHVLDKYNVPTRSGSKRNDLARQLGFAPTAEWLAEQVAMHKTAAAVARVNNIKYHTLVDWFYRLGVEIPTWHGGPGPTGSPTRQDIPVEEAVELSDQGWPYWKIAEKYGVSKGVVMRRFAEVGYSAPKDKQRRLPADTVYAGAPFSHRKVLAELGKTCCQMCDYTEIIQCAHIFPQAKGGPTVVDNVLALCANCHLLLDRYVKELLAGGQLTPPKWYKKVRNKVEAALTKYAQN